jgi:hypothetical protein
MRLRVLTSAALSGPAAVAALVLVAGSASAAQSPAGLLAASLAAGKAQGSVHYIARARFGAEAVTITGDAALDRGRQQIAFTKSGQTGHATVLVVNNTAFIKGDAFTLTNYMRIPATLANRWLSLAHTTSGFKTVAEAVRLGSTLDELKMVAPLQFVPGHSIAGTRTTAIRGKVPQGGVAAFATLYVRAGGLPLPVEQVSTESSGATDTVTFNRWKESVTVAAPSKATPIH